MSYFILILLIVLISATTYILLEENSSNLLKNRLDKISSKEASNKYNPRYYFQQIYLYIIKPFLIKFTPKNQYEKFLKQMLVESGKASSDEEVLRFVGQRFSGAAIGIFIGVFVLFIFGFNLNSFFMAMAFPVFMFLLPIFMLRNNIKQRAQEVTYNLPDALDLLTICVEAGLGLDAALARVSKEFARSSKVLSDELNRISKDILSGISRQDAFRSLANRISTPDVQSLTALLIQTDRLGTSIAQSLRVYCDTLRTRRRQRIEELSQKASIKMMIPMILFILPAMFVVILAPAAISLMQNMK
jgi:tight adherence protein C